MTAIKSITVENLQRLQNITVDFAEAGVTAIMGANGTGKTTLLQALACVYRRDPQLRIEHVTYGYQEFFKPYVGNNWSDSSFSVELYEQNNGTKNYSNVLGNWSPRPQNRTTRYVKYISITDCAPDQEKERERELSGFTKAPLITRAAKNRLLIEKVSAALHKNYADAGLAQKYSGLKSFFYAKTIGSDGQELEYPSHFMGAGEQKIIHIISEVIKAPRGSLILIEELEVSLHESAIRSLMSFLIEQACDPQRQLQIVFTTHWLGIQEFFDDISIVSLYEQPDSKEIVKHNAFDPQFIHSVNGDLLSLRQIKVWVEDGLAKRIITHIAQECGHMQFIDIKTFGSVQNAYSVAGAIAISGDKLDRTLVVTDGDDILTHQAKQDRINSVVTGNGRAVEEWKQNALGLVVDLDAPDNNCPEAVLIGMCQALVNSGTARQWLVDDLRWMTQQIPALTPKQFIYQRAIHKGLERHSDYENQLIQEACGCEAWINYVAPFVERLNQAAVNIGVQTHAEEQEAVE